MRYGCIGLDGKVVAVHRVAWIARNGPIPSGMQVLHTCDNPPCWAEDHLFLGTNADNVADKMAKGRDRYRPLKTHCPAGHSYDEENTLVTSKGRACRECNRQWARRLYHQKRAQSG